MTDPVSPPSPLSPSGSPSQADPSSPVRPPRQAPPANTRTFRIVRNTLAVACLVIVVVLVAVLIGRAAGRPSSPDNYGAVNLPLRPAAPDFATLNGQGIIPANVLDAISVPTNATVVSKAAPDQGISDFKCIVTYDSPSTEAAIAHFFPAELSRQQWRLQQSSSILAQHAGSDGNYWDLGVSVTNGPTSAGSRSPTTSRFTVTLQVQQNGA